MPEKVMPKWLARENLNGVLCEIRKYYDTGDNRDGQIKKKDRRFEELSEWFEWDSIENQIWHFFSIKNVRRRKN